MKFFISMVAIVLLLSGCSLPRTDKKCACGEPVEQINPENS
ncbi:MAG TPA: hypothetical protein VEV44_04395 [Pseudoneobacillus sp.]|nr:hypothetical protein [Pseudoneobacillus sp.]